MTELLTDIEILKTIETALKQGRTVDARAQIAMSIYVKEEQFRLAEKEMELTQ